MAEHDPASTDADHLDAAPPDGAPPDGAADRGSSRGRAHRPHDGRFAFDDRLEERLEVFEEAAIEAELATGRAEETVEEAKRHILVRLGIIVAGSVVTLLGLLMLVLPGPGWLAILAGLLILSKEVPFAARWVEVVRRRLPQDEDGKLPRSAIVSMVAVALVITVGSLWFAFGRG